MHDKTDKHVKDDAILFRHDVDDNLDNSVNLSIMQMGYDIEATYFILDTAPYFNPSDKEMWKKIRRIQSNGHEIGWHNNAITTWIKTGRRKPLKEHVRDAVQPFLDNGINIYGSASHGDRLCYQFGYINYELFQGYMGERVGTAIDFAKPTIEIEKVNPNDFSLHYETYHIPHDLYFSEPGGKWSANGEPRIEKDKRIQVLIHPQWWSL